MIPHRKINGLRFLKEIKADVKINVQIFFVERFREFIEKGAQFTRLAVQEPWGVMILQVLPAHEPQGAS